MQNLLRQWRRARNVRKGQGARGPRVPRQALALAALFMLAAGAGALLIVIHARMLGAAAGQAPLAASLTAESLQGALPGAAFTVPAAPGLQLAVVDGGALAIVGGMQAAPPLRLDLCSQMQAGAQPRLVPLRIGYHFDDVARWVAHKEASGALVTLRNVALAAPATTGMPQVQVSGSAVPGFDGPDGLGLQLRWDIEAGSARWLGDASQGKVSEGPGGSASFLRDGWLAWGTSALRVQRRRSAACEAGELLLQLYRPGAATPRSLVTAYPAHGKPLAAWLAAGQYQVPQAPRSSLEDQALFEQLQARSLVRLAAGGQVELAPRDLAAWQKADAASRAPLPGWEHLAPSAADRALIARLYHGADGRYVREQVDIFNSERRLLAWRLRPGPALGQWQAGAASASVPVSGAMPPAAARLFAELPQGWSPWTRIAAWPAGAGGAELALQLEKPAAPGDSVELMIAGRLLALSGARLRGQPQAVCSGRACPARDAAQVLTLDLAPGARRVLLSVAPLDMAALARPGDQQYRHLRVDGGRLAWQALPGVAAGARAHAPVPVTLTDRNGAMLWSGSGPTPAAMAAGLGTLLGVRAEHVSGVAGMLARTPSATGAPHSARLAIDLALQAASQRALDCIGLKHGRLDGARCEGTRAPPNGRQAGIVVVDADNGDVLAAAGAGLPAVDAANWAEVRDFDRSNPARSPLRLPALQHDGGAHRSPGSTFKVISALGLEQAAQGRPAGRGAAGRDAAAGAQPHRQRGLRLPDRRRHLPGGRQGCAHHQLQGPAPGPARPGRQARPGPGADLQPEHLVRLDRRIERRSLFGRPEGGAPTCRRSSRARSTPCARSSTWRAGSASNRRCGSTAACCRPISTGGLGRAAGQRARHRPDPRRHELRQMAIGLRMQATPLQMALVAGAVGEGRTIAPRLLLALDGRQAAAPAGAAARRAPGPHPRRHEGRGRQRHGGRRLPRRRLRGAAARPVRQDRHRAQSGPGRGPGHRLVHRLAGAGQLPGQPHRLAFAVFVSHSERPAASTRRRSWRRCCAPCRNSGNPGNRRVKLIQVCHDLRPTYGIILADTPSRQEEGMRLPGTRYQEPGWEQVRKLLGQCSLACFALRWAPARSGPPGRAAGPVRRPLAGAARRRSRSARAQAPATAMATACSNWPCCLAYELQARPADWSALRRRRRRTRALRPFWRQPGGDACCARRSTTCTPSCATRSTPTITRPPAAVPAARTASTPTACSIPPMARSRACSAPGASTAPGRRHPRARARHGAADRSAPAASIAGCRPNGSCAGAPRWSASRARPARCTRARSASPA
jgi:hypothetical protein